MELDGDAGALRGGKLAKRPELRASERARLGGGVELRKPLARSLLWVLEASSHTPRRVGVLVTSVRCLWPSLELSLGLDLGVSDSPEMPGLQGMAREPEVGAEA